MSWTDERVELLRKLWLEGLSASQIASELSNGITRNAVIGKVHRLGLSGRAKAPSQAAARPRGQADPHAFARAARACADDARQSRPRADAARDGGAAAAQGATGRSRHPHVGAGDHHGAARVHVPLAARRPGLARLPLLRRRIRRSARAPTASITRAWLTSRRAQDRARARIR